MKAFLSICILGAIANFGIASPQGLLILNNDGAEEVKPSSQAPPRPYAPLPPMQLPPHFQNLGFSLPPPPPPPLLQFQTLGSTPFQHLQLGQADERFLFSFLAQLKPMLFPWLRPTTTEATPTTAAPATSATTGPTTEPTTPAPGSP